MSRRGNRHLWVESLVARQVQCSMRTESKNLKALNQPAKRGWRSLIRNGNTTHDGQSASNGLAPSRTRMRNWTRGPMRGEDKGDARNGSGPEHGRELVCRVHQFTP